MPHLPFTYIGFVTIGGKSTDQRGHCTLKFQIFAIEAW